MTGTPVFFKWVTYSFFTAVRIKAGPLQQCLRATLLIIRVETAMTGEVSGHCLHPARWVRGSFWIWRVYCQYRGHLSLSILLWTYRIWLVGLFKRSIVTPSTAASTRGLWELLFEALFDVGWCGVFWVMLDNKAPIRTSRYGFNSRCGWWRSPKVALKLGVVWRWRGWGQKLPSLILVLTAAAFLKRGTVWTIRRGWVREEV